MATGWTTIGGKKYYFKKASGDMLTGTNKVGNYLCKFTSSGVFKGYASKGKQTADGNTYYVGANGKLIFGWQTISGKKYYFKKDGTMATGWTTISGKEYYFNNAGVLTITE